MQAVDGLVDVRRVLLTVEEPVRVALDLAAERVDVATQRRGRLGEKRGVTGEPVLEREAEQLLAHPPVRVRRRLAGQRRAQDRPRHRVEPVLGGHLGVVHALREGELLVRVADAVAPGQREVLHEERPLRVLHARFRHLDQRGFPEAPLPVGGDRRAGLVVRGGGHEPRAAATRPGDPGRLARGELRRQRALSGREPHPRARPGLERQPHEARQAALAVEPRAERLLREPAAGRAAIARSEDRQPAFGERRAREPREAGSVPLAADDHAEARAAEASSRDPAPVGHMQRDRARALCAERLRERHGVDARVGERPARRAGEDERRQEAVGARRRRPRGRAKQLLAPDVPSGAKRTQHGRRVGRSGARRRAGGGEAHAAPRGAGRDSSGEDREHRPGHEQALDRGGPRHERVTSSFVCEV